MRLTIPVGLNKFGREVPGTQWVEAFNKSNCECCGATIMAANSIKVAKGDAPKLQLVMVTKLPEDGGYSEAFGGETCLDCVDHGRPAPGSN